MRTILTLEQIESLPKLISDDMNTEGSLHICDTLLFKIFKNYDDELESNINRLLSYVIDGKYSWPLDKICFNDKFCGIVLNYYRDYYSFGSCLNNNSINLNDKIIICIQFIEALKKLHNNGIAHGDLHLGNIMTNGEEALIIDLDRCVFVEDATYDSFIKYERFQSMASCLSILYNIDIIDFKQSEFPNLSWSMFLNYLGMNTNLINFVKEMQNDNDIYFDIYLNSLNINQIEKEVKKVKNIYN